MTNVMWDPALQGSHIALQCGITMWESGKGSCHYIKQVNLNKV